MKLSKGTKILITSVAIFLLLFLGPPIHTYLSGRQKIYKEIDLVGKHRVGIVLGAGVTLDYEPAVMLRDRLDTAALLYEAGKVDRLLLSGNNSDITRNETTVMYEYLTREKGIPARILMIDPYGNRTYDTCIRAKRFFTVDEAILVTQGYHLPRAILLCNEIGLESVGISATEKSYLGESFFKLREFLAIHKAYIDLYLMPPNYIGIGR